MDKFQRSDLHTMPIGSGLCGTPALLLNHTWLLFCLIIGSTFSSLASVSISGPSTACIGSTNEYVATPDALPATFLWTLGTNNNTAGAVLLGDATNSTVTVIVTTNGSFDLQCDADDGGGVQTATTNVLAPEPVQLTPLASQMACPGDTAIFFHHRIRHAWIHGRVA